jgi:SAM-dependent methyltransferase
MTFDGTANFSAYDQVEALSNYRTQEALRAYRLERLGKYAPYVAMLSTLGIADGEISVVDIGSGSSAFLYALEREGLLRAGVGIELSETRHAFAERWRHDEGFERVSNVRANFTDVPFGSGGYDLVSVLDDTYLYLRPESADYPTRLFETARRGLRPGGRLVLDFRNDVPAVAAMPPEGRSFSLDLPETNTFASAFYRQAPSPDQGMLLNESRYVAPDGMETTKVEITEVCDVPMLVQELRAAGFDAVTVFGDLSLAPFDELESLRAIVVARSSPLEDR